MKKILTIILGLAMSACTVEQQQMSLEAGKLALEAQKSYQDYRLAEKQVYPDK